MFRFAKDTSIGLETYDCRYGRMHVLSSDTVIGRSLRLYGEWAEHELSILRSFVVPGTTVIDVGAHIGTHTLPLSVWVQNGRVIAIEPQPVISSILRDNCVQNERLNVQVINAICGSEIGSFDFRLKCGEHQNLGAISFARTHNHIWRKPFILFTRLTNPKIVTMPMIMLDQFCSHEPVSLIKIDIEGMEFEALLGASKLLAHHRPVVYFEQNDTTKLPHTYDYLVGAGYRLLWLETHPFNKKNFRGVKENIWWRTETGIIAVPQETPMLNSLTEVQRNDQNPPHLLNARAGIEVN